MISAALLARVACPVCLEPEGCPSCRDASGHRSCTERYSARAACRCGGPDKVRLTQQEGALLCPCCLTRYRIFSDAGYVELLPTQALGEETRYADHEFHEQLRVSESPPVLSAGIKLDWMRRMLALRGGETVLDLGSGAGKFALACRRSGLQATGLDMAPFFLPGAAREVDLVVGDMRRLPFRKGSAPKAYSLDVLEHLDEPGLCAVLTEVRRVIGEDGRWLVYTHALESSRIAVFQRAVNRLARLLGRAGLIDHEREAMRKSDHRNPIKSHEHFDELCKGAGLEVVARRYYNVVAKAVVEDLGLRLYERWRRGRKARDARPVSPSPAGGEKEASPGTLWIGRMLTWVLQIDMILFGRVRTGPFFGLVRSRAHAGDGA